MKLLSAIGFSLILCTGCVHERQKSTTSAPATPATPEDPYFWLEDTDSERALDWVYQQNRACTNQLTASPEFASLTQRMLAIRDSKEKIPEPNKRAAYYYNFWRDDHHVRGLWRRTSAAEYRKAQPKWETVLDLDQLAQHEEENWVWSGCRTLYPKHERGLIEITRGGGDTGVVREFDLVKKEFVTNGFTLPEAKSVVMWRDENTVYVGTDFGPGSFTASSYPRIVKEWKRGTPLSAARSVFEGNTNDVGVVGF
ncbi:MAG: S9 family peptidase, partial [Verrucomicrobia bacterium]|nr:S9 family peptidase [Verrucomicrobiota bacterium]